MKSLQIVCYMFFIIRIRPLQSTDICDLEDRQCTTMGADIIYKNIINKLDPLIIKEPIQGIFPYFHYKMNNTKYSSLNTCKPQLVINKNLHTYVNVLRCSQLDIMSPITINGLHLIDETDFVSLTLYDYVIKISGGYKTFVDSDKSTRMSLTEFSVDTKLEGSFTYKVDHMFHVTTLEAYLADVYIKENYLNLEKDLRPVIKALVIKLVETANHFFKATPMHKVFPKMKRRRNCDEH